MLIKEFKEIVKDFNQNLFVTSSVGENNSDFYFDYKIVNEDIIFFHDSTMDIHSLKKIKDLLDLPDHYCLKIENDEDAVPCTVLRIKKLDAHIILLDRYYRGF